MTFDTLQYIDGSGDTQEIALALPNLASTGPATTLKYEPRSHAASTFTITWAQPPETGIAIPFKSRCVIYAGRASGDGSPNSFSGGTILFQGRRTDNEGSASGSRVGMTITLSDAWWDMEKVTLQAIWQQITGGTVAEPTFTTVTYPDCVLFQAALGVTYDPAEVQGHITSWQTIEEIIAYAAAYATGADAIEIQTTEAAEFTPAYVPWYPCRSVKIAQGLQLCLRPHPGVFTEIDYTTTPPTLHFRDRSNLTAVTLPYKSTDENGIVHVASDIQPLEQLVPDAVRIFYKINGTYNGQPILSFFNDLYPADAPNSLLCLDYSCDITGATTVQVTKNFTSNDFDPTDLTLWQSKVPGLRSVAYGGLIPNSGTGALALVNADPYDPSSNVKGIQVLQEGNEEVDLDTFLYWTDQSVYSWFPIEGGTAQVAKATVKAYFNYKKSNTISGSDVSKEVPEHAHSMRVTLTNVPSATYIYKQVTNNGEAIPNGLAESLYNELSILQWKLRHEIIQVAASPTSVPTIIKPGLHMINLSGGNEEWTSMNAAVQSVTVQFYRTGGGLLVAQQTINTGPVDHLEPGYVVQLTNMFWNRNKSGVDANQRLTGNISSNNVDLSATDARENSAPDSPTMQSDVLIAVNEGGNGIIQHDAGQIPPGTTSAHRPISCCDDSGNPVTGYFQCTPPT